MIFATHNCVPIGFLFPGISRHFPVFPSISRYFPLPWEILLFPGKLTTLPGEGGWGEREGGERGRVGREGGWGEREGEEGGWGGR